MLISYVVTILMIVLLESMLSIDNAAVLASIANTKCKERAKDIVRFGIIGAFIFRGLSLFCVSWLMTNEVVGGIGKLLGALYLLRLGYTGLTPQPDSLEEGEVGWIEKIFNKIGISGFWLIVLEVEIIDLVFSIDNLFACVAFTENIKESINNIKQFKVDQNEEVNEIYKRATNVLEKINGDILLLIKKFKKWI